MNNIDIIKNNFVQNQKVNSLSIEQMLNSVESATNLLIDMIDKRGKLLSCGNGGSSGDAQHIASEFINRFETERQELPAISLNSDTATITSIANDYGYEFIFSKQINAIGMKDDILMTFTTSGNSKNITQAIISAKKNGLTNILVCGGNGGEALKILGKDDISIIVPSDRTSRIQEMHLIVIHSICECIDKHLA